MNWEQYQKEIYRHFEKMYPEANIQYDIKILGRYSKTKRQIDILIEDEIAGFDFKIAVDTKYFSRRIDIKCVESFLSMMDDVGASQGIIITSKGFSEAALNRAHFDNRNLELDVINFDPLKGFQGFNALAHSGGYGITISAPLGCVIELNKENAGLAYIIPRGLGLRQAKAKNEWMYISIWIKDKTANNLEELVSLQNKKMESFYDGIEISSRQSSRRKDNKNTYVRIATRKEWDFLELTGFIEHEEFIAFIVCFTPEHSSEKNIRKINYMLKYSIPFKIKSDNRNIINTLKKKLKTIGDTEQRIQTFMKLAGYLKLDKKYDMALKYLRLGFDENPSHYSNIIQLMTTELTYGDTSQSFLYARQFFTMNYANPTSMQDIIYIFGELGSHQTLQTIIKTIAKEHEKSPEALANIFFHYGIYLQNIGDRSQSLKYLQKAKENFLEFNQVHYVLPKLNSMILDTQSND